MLNRFRFLHGGRAELRAFFGVLPCSSILTLHYPRIIETIINARSELRIYAQHVIWVVNGKFANPTEEGLILSIGPNERANQHFGV